MNHAGIRVALLRGEFISPRKRCAKLAYKQLFEGRLHVKRIELFNDRVEKGDVLGDGGYLAYWRLIGGATIKGYHEGGRKSERFKYQQL